MNSKQNKAIHAVLDTFGDDWRAHIIATVRTLDQLFARSGGRLDVDRVIADVTNERSETAAVKKAPKKKVSAKKQAEMNKLGDFEAIEIDKGESESS